MDRRDAEGYRGHGRKTSGTEIERGQIAQRGQDELNQRARKAAVQTPGKALSNMQMGVRPGGLVVQ
jgi:hypothetical protein